MSRVPIKNMSICSAMQVAASTSTYQGIACDRDKFRQQAYVTLCFRCGLFMKHLARASCQRIIEHCSYNANPMLS
jgi:hypothetical protein